MAKIYRRVGGRKIEKVIALHETVQKELERRAFEMGVRAEALLQNHHVEHIAHIEVDEGDVDKYVILVDSNVTNSETKNSNSALSIEFGRAGYIDQHGIEYGSMDGLYILTQATHIPRRHKPVPRKRRDR